MTNPNLPSDAELDRLICLFTREPSEHFSFTEEDIVGALMAAQEVKTLRKQLETAHELRVVEVKLANQRIAQLYKLRNLLSKAEPLISDLHTACNCVPCRLVRDTKAECQKALKEGV